MTRFDILLGAGSLRGHRSGIGRHTAEILAGLLRRPDLGSLFLLDGGHVHRAQMAHVGPASRGANGSRVLQRVASFAAEIPGLASLGETVRRRQLSRTVAQQTGAVVLYHEPNFVPAPFDGPCTVAVHDMFWREQPDLLPRERRLWLERNMRRVLAQARGFACVSAFTARELRRHVDVGERAVAIVPNAAAARFRPIDAVAARPVLARYGLSDRRYIVTVATIEPRKNLGRLLAAHRRLPPADRRHHPLVLIGQGNEADVAQILDGIGADDHVRWLGFVPDDDLAPLLARAAAACVVSLYEGFGLPVLEAMASGTPVLAANTTGTAEAAGEAALSVDPLEVSAIRDGLRRLIDDVSLGDQLRRQGLARAAGFQWDRSVDALVDLWTMCLAR